MQGGGPWCDLGFLIGLLNFRHKETGQAGFFIKFRLTS
ncbi:hypothetical protein ACZ87_01229 [Candidatus Erwinia dacicola]|uniref:Uncharacterized protein n=1 Tax=Candidatus Erwinia dacicola TaxID=252393 RepID=A0A328TVW0_9GAMM|nr:hypothetical protein ACZ87_01229 [Candidatus Erwinia dacicola]